MTEPLTWQLVEAIRMQLQHIHTTKGYRTDLGIDVRLEPWAPDELIGEITARMYVFATQMQRNTETSGPRTKKDTVTIVIDVMVPTGQGDAHQQAHRALADVRRALIEVDPRVWLPAGIGLPEITSQQIDPRPEGLKLIRVQVGVSALITETVATN